MKRSRFTEEQIIGILKEYKTGISVADLSRKYGVSDAGIYNWKAKYGGMDVSEARRLKSLEDENARLKRLLADGHMNFPRSSRLAYSESPIPSCHRILVMSPRRPRKM